MVFDELLLESYAVARWCSPETAEPTVQLLLQLATSPLLG